ncbi:CKLF-like MARVEL transmembrane domain-containing protein 5 isoform X2 [Hylobates moloch]|uniref:CKLF-like MARVEL transmembrane domain-containing protein 5 isoform X2 n=1 Tax=Hylobates moloch TaxID=81572 RepID=UPI0013645A2D|nr:CKLF-like MARVEL transmembrane domain-containing protein 5 isoform X2 [Hylobates moloch]
MLSARDRRDRTPEEGVVAELQGFAVDKAFLTSHKGILLETELALTLIIFICFTASVSAYMAAALLEFFITLAFLFLYATQYYQRLNRLNWPCLLQGHRESGGPHPLDLLSHSAKVQPQPWPGLIPPGWSTPAAVPWAPAPAPGFWSWLLWFICFHSLGSSDFLRCVSAIIIFLVVSFAAVTSRDGAAIAAFVFGIILVSVFAYDAFKIYRTEMAPGASQGDQQ